MGSLLAGVAPVPEFLGSWCSLSGIWRGGADGWAVFPAGEGPLAPPAAVVSLSSVTGEGLEDLGNAVAALFPAGDPGEAAAC